jgi:hypothetical protein
MVGQWSDTIFAGDTESERVAARQEAIAFLQKWNDTYQYPPAVFDLWVRQCLERKRFMEETEFLETVMNLITARDTDEPTALVVFKWALEKAM